MEEIAAFSASLRDALSSKVNKKVSEEELFAAVLAERLGKVNDSFANVIETITNELEETSDGAGVEDMTVNLLNGLVKEEKLSKEVADTLYSEAFALSQLDDDKESLFDGRGGPGDRTVATMERDGALQRAQLSFSELGEGLEVKSRSLKPEVGDNKGFLYKPVSDTTGKLVILSPTELSGEIAKVRIREVEGRFEEIGKFSGNGNGGRDHFRFSKSGSSYRAPLIVEFTLNSGATREILIKDSGERYEE
jgi:hypothetical protein